MESWLVTWIQPDGKLVTGVVQGQSEEHAVAVTRAQILTKAGKKILARYGLNEHVPFTVVKIDMPHMRGWEDVSL